MVLNTKEYVPSFVIKIGGEEFRHGFSADVTSLTVTDVSNQADDFSFTVRDRNPDSARFPGGVLKWMDSGKLEQGKEVEIEFGYRGSKQRKFVGVITAISPTFPESGVPAITVRGRSLYDRLNNQCDAKAFTAKTDSGIAQEIADKLKLKSVVDETKPQRPLVSSESGTYCAVLKKLADRIGFEVVVKERTLYFQRPRYIVGKSQGLVLEWGKSLKSFTPTLSTYKKYTDVSVRTSQTSFGKGKDPLEGTAGPGDERATMGKESASTISMRISGQNLLRADDHDAVSQEEAKEVALASLEKSSLEFITGKGACNGNPSLAARMVIELQGLGKLFSGSYYVTSVTHVIDGSGYRTDFEVKRNGI